MPSYSRWQEGCDAIETRIVEFTEITRNWSEYEHLINTLERDLDDAEILINLKNYEGDTLYVGNRILDIRYAMKIFILFITLQFCYIFSDYLI